MELQDTYDEYLNACYADDAQEAVAQVLTKFRTSGVPERQINKIINKAEQAGVILTKKNLPEIIFEADEVYVKISDKSAFQNVADKFLLFIYDKKFNDGIHGAFGTAQTIKATARGYKIILRLPKSTQDSYDTFKFMSSIRQYRCNANGKVIIEYV